MKEKKQQQEDDNQFNMNLLYAPELEKAVLGTLMTDKKAYALISVFFVQNLFTNIDIN